MRKTNIVRRLFAFQTFFILVLSQSGTICAESDQFISFSFKKTVPVHYATQSRVYQTALSELAASFGLKSATELNTDQSEELIAGGILLTTMADCPLVPEFVRHGLIDLHNLPAAADACEIFFYKDCLILLGNTPRGMLQAVYRMQEWSAEGRVLNADLHQRDTFQIERRIFHGRFNNWPAARADVRYISHLGATHCLVTHDWQGDKRHFYSYETSPVFPNIISSQEVKENKDRLRNLIDNCKDYGLEAALWITELPCQGGPWVSEEGRQQFLGLFNPDVLSDSGTYQGKVLCFGHPKVQEFYRDLMARFFKDFPEISILFVFGLDANGEFCNPEACERCKGMSKFEQRDRFLNFLIKTGQEVRPGLRVLTTNWGWANLGPDEFAQRQIKLPQESGIFMAAQYDGWQVERQCHNYMCNLRNICRDKDQLYIGYDNLHWGDDSVHHLNDIQDYPLGIGAKLQRWFRLQVDGVFDHWGMLPEDISCNSIACRDFFLNPLADPQTVSHSLAVHQFGPQAGEYVYAAWDNLEKAHQILSNACSWSPSQWPGWYSGREILPTPEGFKQNSLGGGQFPTPTNGFTYNIENLAERLAAVGEAWHLAWPYYEKAIAQMDLALAAADDQPVFYQFWWNGEKPSPTRREHIRRQKLYIESTGKIGREIGLHFSLNALYEKTKGDDAAYLKQGVVLLHELQDACMDASNFMERLKNQGNERQKERNWDELYRKKAEGIRNYLSAHPDQ